MNDVNWPGKLTVLDVQNLVAFMNVAEFKGTIQQHTIIATIYNKLIQPPPVEPPATESAP